MILTLVKLYWSFVKIGFTSFGGLSMIPLISHEVVSNGWMSLGEVSDIVAIAEMTPGPLGLNCATFAGIHAAGIPGAVVANLGVLTPTLTLTAAVGIFFERFQKNRRMEQLLTGVRPVCIGLLAGVVASFCRRAQPSGGADRRDRPFSAASLEGQHSQGDPAERRAGADPVPVTARRPEI